MTKKRTLLLIYRELNILCVKYSLYSPYGDDVIKQDGASSCSHITDTVLAVWRRWQLLAKRRNMQLCGLIMISSRSRSRLWVLSMSRPLVFCSLSSCFNAFLSPSSAFVRRFFCLLTTRISAASDPNFLHYFFSLPREYTYRGKIIIIIIKYLITNRMKLIT